jgi:hypothetical protein
LEKKNIPTSIITAMHTLAFNVGATRIVAGTKIPHPCGNPEIPEKRDLEVTRKILMSALELLQKNVEQHEIVTIE